MAAKSGHPSIVSSLLLLVLVLGVNAMIRKEHGNKTTGTNSTGLQEDRRASETVEVVITGAPEHFIKRQSVNKGTTTNTIGLEGNHASEGLQVALDSNAMVSIVDNTFGDNLDKQAKQLLTADDAAAEDEADAEADQQLATFRHQGRRRKAYFTVSGVSGSQHQLDGEHFIGNGNYVLQGMHNGKPSYGNDAGDSIMWQSSAWAVAHMLPFGVPKWTLVAKGTSTSEALFRYSNADDGGGSLHWGALPPEDGWHARPSYAEGNMSLMFKGARIEKCKDKKVLITSYKGENLRDNKGQIELLGQRVTGQKRKWDEWTISDAGDGKFFIKGHRGLNLHDHNGDIGFSNRNVDNNVEEKWTIVEWTINTRRNGKVLIRSHRNKNLRDNNGTVQAQDDTGSSDQWVITLPSRKLC